MELIFLGHELNVVGKEFVFVAQVDCCDTEKIRTGIISCGTEIISFGIGNIALGTGNNSYGARTNCFGTRR